VSAAPTAVASDALPSGEPVLEARALAVARGSRRVLRDVSLELSAGEALAVIGPNAAGKSTLVRALAGLLEPSGGVVSLLGRPLATWPSDARARELALATSEEEGPDALTVWDRVALGRYPHLGPFRRPSGSDQEAVVRALEQTGIAALAGRRLGTLSAGERQLASLARGLAQEPRVLLLDEPAAHLDIGHQLQLLRTLDAARRRGVAVLAVMHDLARAAQWAGRMLLLAEGAVAARGAPDEVLSSEAASRAFGVRIRAHAVPPHAQRFYSFEEA
jgi:iron complex transport system ATP-binding protein